MKRVFLGIDLSEELKNKIEKLKKQNQLDRLSIKLVEPKNSHLALKFLDKLDDSQIQQIDRVVEKQIKQFQPFEIRIKNSLIFPHLQRPRVLALQVISLDLVNFGTKLIKELEELPFVISDQRKYTPHITLGRIKEKLTDAEKEKIASLKFDEEFRVECIQLFKSQLTSTGPLYHILKEYQL